MKLPPMNALRAFEAVSRPGSVSKAADELCGGIDLANPEPIPAPYKCYFVSPASARPNSALIAFRDWLVDALKKFGV